ncbi:MAG: twin-arginine translocase TatA/TatE family subunit [Thermoproteus sp.]|jgi:sec-independent protein translocase protein TatA|nr:twin-arginine translocase TatA/TatE family subunit [Thermoproteus sp.]MDT7869985.1 twin-arginine translocase TatA/TatE family subunit [Thermoproteus sp.]MDT7882713.1 twin-arginine translocase TatA/TatE family subunit [Thermoproteus sp.]MDT7882783.1 twin-arginine translocase TatA/TatE family subunit [Thermoproteus sp.]
MWLFITGQDWLIILIAVVILLIWGPSKLPALARGLGQALHEFRRASQGLAAGEDEEYRKLLEVAKNLGINTEGKTKEQILEEVNRKVAEMNKKIALG